MKKFLTGLVLFSVLTVGLVIPTACSNDDEGNDVSIEPDIGIGAPSLPSAQTNEDPQKSATDSFLSDSDDDRMIIYNGDISIVVEDITASLDKIIQLTAKYEGYVVSSNISGEDYEMRGWISLRVPAADFEAALAEIGTLAEKVTSKSTSSQDVTEEYIDLAARLANAVATESQYLALLDMAKDVDDVLNIYNSLSNVRQQIEQLKARIQYIERTAEMAIIYAYLEPTGSEAPIVDSDWDIVEVLKDAARGIITLGEWLVTGLVWLTIFSPLWGIALFFCIRCWRRRKARA